jgi:hypothetical protein
LNLYLHWVKNVIYAVHVDHPSIECITYLSICTPETNTWANSLCCMTAQILFVENTRLTSTLLEEIDVSQLPDIYGGQLALAPIQDS